MSSYERIKQLKQEMNNLKLQSREERARSFVEWCKLHFGRMPVPGDKLVYTVRYYKLTESRASFTRTVSAVVLNSDDNLPWKGESLEHISPGLCKDDYHVPCLILKVRKPTKVDGYVYQNYWQGKCWLSKTNMKRFQLKDC